MLLPAWRPISIDGLNLAAPVIAAADVVFGRGGPGDLALDLYRPAEDGEPPRPVVVFIHGGGWHGGDKESYRDLAARVASHGYLSAAVNYRLSGQAPFPAALEDCKCAVRWLRAQATECGADSGRLAVWGHSAGAHLAAMVALTPGKFEGRGGWPQASSGAQGALCFSAPFDFPALGDSLRPSVDELLGPEATSRPALRVQASPISHVTRSAPAFLVCHGDQDDVVPVDQSDRFAAAMREAGAPVELMRVPGAGHDLERYSEDIFARALGFLDRHLKPLEAAPPGAPDTRTASPGLDPARGQARAARDSPDASRTHGARAEAGPTDDSGGYRKLPT